jgi:hypothetical protein
MYYLFIFIYLTITSIKGLSERLTYGLHFQNFPQFFKREVNFYFENNQQFAPFRSEIKVVTIAFL